MVHLEGSLLGYASAAQILRDAGIGVYAQGVATDFGEARLQRFLTNMYITDLLLGVEPWLNENTVCSFPSPWSNVPISTNETYPPAIDPPEDSSIFVGTYGNFQFGNVTVQEDSESSRPLRLTYGTGKWSLRPIAENKFLGEPDDDTFPFYLKEVIFRKENSGTGQFDEVTFNIIGTDPNIFERDLKMSEEPPVENVNCDLKCDANCSSMQVTSFVLIVLMSVVSFFCK